VRIEHFHQLGEVGQRAREAIHLVDHHHLDTACADLRQELLQPWTLHRAARVAAVFKGADHLPAQGLLAEHVSGTGLALGVQRVEVLLEAFFGGLAGVIAQGITCADRRR
jgi:hypothetical protein